MNESSSNKFKPKQILLVLVVVGLAYAGKRFGLDLDGSEAATGGGTTVAEAPEPRAPKTEQRSKKELTGAEAIAAAFRDNVSGLMVEAEGKVKATLPDDNDGSRHQRFIVTLSDGNTVLIAHNIDLAKRVPLERGDALEFKGQYEWNEKGGVVHWTHHDPQGRHPGGWIRHASLLYQ